MAEEGVTKSITNAPEHEEPFVVTIQRLAELPVNEYERIRKDEAKHLNMRTSVLDREVNAARPKSESENDLGLFEPDPWPEEVDGDDLLDQIVKAICRYIVMPAHTAEATALWAVHCHCFQNWQQTPRLAVGSPEKGCGKSTLLDVLSHLVPRSITSENLSSAVLFRVIEAHHPVLLVDEVDTFLRDDEELRGILNSGHRKGGRVLRCEGDDHAVKAFATFSPVVTGGLGRLPGTLEDRSIPVLLQKRKPSERISSFRSDRTKDLHDLASQAARWVCDNQTALRDHEPEMPRGLFNRLADNWRPLLAIADVAGGDWPDTARIAALALCDQGDDAETLKVKLLADIQTIFHETGAERLLSAALAEHLHKMEDRPWPEYGRSNKPISTAQIARLLKGFRIAPNTIRTDTGRAKGYYLPKFKEAFERYLSPYPPSQSVTEGQVNVEAGLTPIPKRDNGEDVTLRETPKSTADKGCPAVTARKGGEGDIRLCVQCGLGIEDGAATIPAKGRDGTDGHIHDGCYDRFIAAGTVQEIPAFMDRR